MRLVQTHKHAAWQQVKSNDPHILCVPGSLEHKSAKGHC